jgi:RNA polymerase sigma factor (sigma-70 family)
MSSDSRGDGPLPEDRAECHDPVVALIKQAQNGCPHAERALYDQYAAEIRSFIRQQLLLPSDPLRCDLDSDDIGQETWSAVFATLKRDKLFADERAFAGFLRQVARNCYRKGYRARVTTQKRSRRREQRLEPADGNLPGNDPDPAQLAALAERWRVFLASLPTDELVILMRRSQGEKVAQIAQDSGLAVRTVQSIIHRLRQRWEAEAGIAKQ